MAMVTLPSQIFRVFVVTTLDHKKMTGKCLGLPHTSSNPVYPTRVPIHCQTASHVREDHALTYRYCKFLQHTLHPNIFLKKLNSVELQCSLQYACCRKTTRHLIIYLKDLAPLLQLLQLLIQLQQNPRCEVQTHNSHLPHHLLKYTS